jgi:hypothetical protein
MNICRLYPCKTLVLLFTIFILLGVAPVSGDETEVMEVKPVKYVEINQKDGKTERLEYDTFTMSWFSPITLKTHFALEEVQIKKEDIDRIYITIKYPHGWEEDKEDWLVKIFLVGDIEWTGFLHVSEYMVRGTSIINGEEKSIPFDGIKKIQFIR